MTRSFRLPRVAAALPCLFALLGCGSDPGAAKAPAARVHTPTSGPIGGGSSKPALCSRPGDDEVHDLFCGDTAPAITSLSDLQTAFGIAFPGAETGHGYSSMGYDGFDGSRVVLLAHSTSLSGDLVSPINPRAIVVGAMTFIAFNRGVQQVELASLERQTGTTNFYLIQFEQSCNSRESGCRSGDLFTPHIESDWTRVAISEAEDLKNTPSDCRQCHQRNRDEPVLLMRELDGPWTHFFAPDQADTSEFPEPSGSDLLRDYLAAKGDEPYASIPSHVLRSTLGFTLENLVHFPQPLVFDGSTIMNERWPWDPTTAYAPTPVRSATWDATYEAFKRGEQLAMPYHAPRATDPDKQSKLTDAYQRYLSGDIAADALPDFADIFPDDPQTRAEIGLQAEPSATPAEALVQACGTCHNDVLDQSISRARFNVALSRLNRAELDEAVARLELPRDAPGSMPPPGRRQLDPATLAPLIHYLEAGTRSANDDALLDRAAFIGMAPKTPF